MKKTTLILLISCLFFTCNLPTENKKRPYEITYTNIPIKKVKIDHPSINVDKGVNNSGQSYEITKMFCNLTDYQTGEIYTQVEIFGKEQLYDKVVNGEITTLNNVVIQKYEGGILLFNYDN